MARELVVKVIGDSTSFEKSLQKSSKAAKKFNGEVEKTSRGLGKSESAFARFKKAAVFPSTFAVGGIAATAVLKDMVDASLDFAEQQSKTNAVFDESAAQVQAWAKTTTNAFGISRRQALETASSFGALFAPIGIVGREAAKQSEKLTELGADLASFYNTDVQGALDAIRSGLVGESEPLRAYGVRLSETRVQQQAMADTGKKNAKALTEQEKALARIEIIFRDTTKAQGDFAKSADRLPAKIKKAQGHIDNFKVSLGEYAVVGLGTAIDWTDRFGRSLGSLAFDIQEAARKPKPFGLLGDWLGLTGGGPSDIRPGEIKGFTPWWKRALDAAGGPMAAAPPPAVTRQMQRSAEQLNRWFDDMVGRKLFRASDKPFREQLAVLNEVSRLLTQRIKVTDDITRKRNLEDQLIQVQRDKANLVAEHTQQQADAAERQKQAAQAALEKEKQLAEIQRQRRQAAEERKMGWLELALERAQWTKGIGDDIKAVKAIIAFLKKQIRLHGRTLELVRQLLEMEHELADLQSQRKKTVKKGGGGGERAASPLVPVDMFRQGAGAPTVRPAARPSSGFGIGATYNIQTLVVQANNPADMEQKLQRRSQQRPQTRRGPV